MTNPLGVIGNALTRKSGPLDMNILQKLGGVLQATATRGQSLQPILQQQAQQRELRDVGNVLAGSGIPEFARRDQTPGEIQRAKQLQLASLGTPTAFEAIKTLREPALTPFQQATLGMRREEALARRGEAAARRSEAQETRRFRREQADLLKQEKGVERLSKRIEGTGIPELFGSLGRLENLIPEKGDIAGFGVVEGSLPDLVVGEQGREIRQEIAQVQNSILKARSGGAVTPSEAQRLLKELGTGVGATEGQLRRGIKNVRRAFKDKLKSIEAGFGQDVVDRFSNVGGVTSKGFDGSPNAVRELSDEDLLRMLGQ